MNNGTRESWASDPNARSLRVDPGKGSGLLLPLAHFLYAEIKSGGGELRAVFASHEVILRGSALSRLAGLLQRGELASVTAVSSGPDEGAEGQTVIREIIVKAEEKDPGAAMPGNQAA